MKTPIGRRRCVELTRIERVDLHDAIVALYQLSYSPVIGQGTGLVPLLKPLAHQAHSRWWQEGVTVYLRPSHPGRPARVYCSLMSPNRFGRSVR